jgi:hypothetical protein
MSSHPGQPRSTHPRRLAAATLACVTAAVAIVPLAAATASADSAPNYGEQEIRIGVQIHAGAYVSDGTTTANTETTITETGPNASFAGPPTCQTDGSTQEIGSSATYCTFQSANSRAAADIPFDQFYIAEPGDTVTITQTTVNANLLIDSSTMTFGPCLLGVGTDSDLCSTPQTALFNDPGIPPTAQNDSGTVTTGGTVVIDVTANDDSRGAPSTIAIDTPPADGAATPISSSNAASAKARGAGVAATSIRYTPNAGFSGHDSFTYTLTDANGSSNATVSITVTAAPPPPTKATPPTAVNDTATTASGRAVTIDVQSNDDPNGSGALHLTSVGRPSHGTATISGTSIVYRPANSFSGVDHFTYTTANSGGSASARVTVTVTAPMVSTTSTPTSARLAPTLPNTGAPIASMVGCALILVTGGSLLDVIGRRKRRGYAAVC